MKALVLNRNPLGSEGVQQLCKCLHNLRALDIAHCNISGADVSILAQNIKSMSSPVRLLENIDVKFRISQVCLLNETLKEPDTIVDKAIDASVVQGGSQPKIISGEKFRGGQNA